jgi:hypothetical protein
MTCADPVLGFHSTVDLWRSAPATGSTAADRIDAKQGLIRGVSVLQATEARGHGIVADATFLNQIAAAINASPTGVKSRFKHPENGSDALGWMVGKVRNAKVDGDKVIGDLQLFQSAKSTPNGDLFGYVIQLATEAPEDFGLSIAFVPDIRWRLSDGSEVPAARAKDGSWIRPLGAATDLPVARLVSLQAVDVVGAPAANPSGLFAAASPSNTASDHHQESAMDPKVLASLSARFKGHGDAIITMLAEGKTETQIVAALEEKTKVDLAAKADELLKLREKEKAEAAVALKAEQDKAAAALAAKDAELTKLQAKLKDVETLGKGAPKDPGGSDPAPGLAGEPPLAALEKQWAEDAKLREKFLGDKSVFLALATIDGRPNTQDASGRATAWRAMPIGPGTIGFQGMRPLTKDDPETRLAGAGKEN